MPTLQAGEPQRKVWTREEAARLTDLFPGQRYELIEGELIDKMGQKPPHAYLIALLTTLLSHAFANRVRVQLPISLPDPEGITSEPEPDLVVLKSSSADYMQRHPGPQDIVLLIEVSDTTLQFDRDTKARLYARSGIKNYGIVDIPQRRLISLQEPGGDEYKMVRIFQIEDVADLGVISVDVKDLFTVA